MNAGTHCEVQLPGFEAPEGCPRCATPQEKRVNLFRREEVKEKLRLANLKRIWDQAGCPPCDAIFKELLLRCEANEVKHVDVIEMEKLITAMMEAGEKISGEKTKLWSFPEVCTLIEKQDLFPLIRDADLTAAAFKSTVGKLLTSYKGVLFKIGEKQIAFELKGKHRARKYFVRAAPLGHAPPNREPRPVPATGRESRG